jgi:hypothetical protein
MCRITWRRYSPGLVVQFVRSSGIALELLKYCDASMKEIVDVD